jgi:4-amino-4-deoxy-L-arabinose transferase-like glycosyltransferase
VTRAPRPAWREVGLVRGVVGAGALVALFWVPVALLDPAYLEGFALANLRRFGTKSPHAAPLWYYLLWVPVLALPWTLLAGPALVRAARDPARRALVLWAAFVPAFLSLASGKLATYALSTLVPLALVVGPELARTVREGPRAEDAAVLRVGGWLAAALLAAAALAAALAYGRLPLSVAGGLLCAVAALAWAAALGVALRRDRLALVPAAVLGATLTLYPLLVRVVAPAASTLASDREAARMIAAAGPGPVIAFAARAPSLVFYLQAPVIHTEDPAQAADLFALDTPVFLVTGHHHFDEIERALGARAHPWLGNARRRLYANRPPPEAPRRNGSE